jgi:hypothetical protein
MTFQIFDTSGSDTIAVLIIYATIVFIVFLILNRINSSKMIDLVMFLCIAVHFISLCVHLI